MSHVAKLIMSGGAQLVCLPTAYRFDSKEVFIRKDPETGEVILSCRPDNWDSFFDAVKRANIPADFLSPEERRQDVQQRDPFANAAGRGLDPLAFS
ncbi:antitoxin [Duganella violaceipulchra]|uniref:AbrB/MazE/SpoVT family DNA-binding domain-containing protein n=1 Tax=Duganella violaceipulchra TaxID=2849652 RepID=A0AA41H6Y9_9BURK|nr:AbrB/MazE/SpoVT family DNA-binding domain-containing protein [Duganella violaceicalia]MBV6323163.1 AbrB/MazE/SpoVT family DNA-binding domain-containing protein [Duganella violaceicalia]MCP2010051.1 antitoxin VapB [Duganella violaceicalia]